MSQHRASDFGSLYRAAFAERDPERKLALLRQVQAVIHTWEQNEDTPVQSLKLAPQPVTRPTVSAVA